MINHKGCIKISACDLKELRRKIKKDGFILNQRNGIYARYMNTNDRFNPVHKDVFYTPFIGYFKDNGAYIRESILSHYKKESFPC